MPHCLLQIDPTFNALKAEVIFMVLSIVISLLSDKRLLTEKVIKILYKPLIFSGFGSKLNNGHMKYSKVTPLSSPRGTKSNFNIKVLI